MARVRHGAGDGSAADAGQRAVLGGRAAHRRPGSHPAALTVTGPGARIRIPVRLRVTGPTLSALTVEHVSVTRRGAQR
ncbi:hypothetical protein O1L55_27525 [Streptomyces albulus]|nr:hypothetical protein [Streptomyces noursei]